METQLRDTRIFIAVWEEEYIITASYDEFIERLREVEREPILLDAQITKLSLPDIPQLKDL